MNTTPQRLALNHATLGPGASFATCVDLAAATGFGAVGLWLDRLDDMAPAGAGRVIRDAGLGISGVNRCGFFVAGSSDQRRAAIDLCRRQIDATADLGAQTLIVVPGGLAGGVALQAAREMVLEGLSSIIGHARDRGVQLAIEPFHPGMTCTHSVINRLGQALVLCDALGEGVGVVTDILHIWWDPDVDRAIARAGSRILAHHLCDWAPDTTDPRADRALMGDGVGDAARLTSAVLAAGYTGWHEVEIFSRALWQQAPEDIARICLEAARSCMAEAQRIAAPVRE